jgi:TP901-1 family phage major tail protein
MAAQAGKHLLLKLKTGTAFAAVAGLRSRTLSFNAGTVDATHLASPGPWRELLGGAGLRSLRLTGSGIFKDAPSDALIRQLFFDAALRDWQVVIPDFGVVEGPFQIASLHFQGPHDGEVSFDIALESAGEMTFTAL